MLVENHCIFFMCHGRMVYRFVMKKTKVDSKNLSYQNSKVEHSSAFISVGTSKKVSKANTKAAKLHPFTSKTQ